MRAAEYMDDAVIHDGKTGAVVYTEKTRRIPAEGFQTMRDACPYDIPRRHPATGLISKCDMCFGRVSRGLLPMCVAVCPTGCMNFGERQEMLSLAEKRLAVVKKEHPDAALVDAGEVNVIFLLMDSADKYHEYASARHAPGMDRKAFLARLGAPLREGIRALSSL